MEKLHLPFKIRWVGEPMPDLSDFVEPLVIPFRYIDAINGMPNDGLASQSNSKTSGFTSDVPSAPWPHRSGILSR